MLPKFVRPLAKRRGFAEGELLLHWPRIAAGMAPVTRPLGLYKGCLTLAVASSSVAQEVMFQKEGLMSTINMFMGHGAVTDIRCKVQTIVNAAPEPDETFEPPAPNKVTQRRVGAVTDEGLRDSLSKLLSLYQKGDNS